MGIEKIRSRAEERRGGSWRCRFSKSRPQAEQDRTRVLLTVSVTCKNRVNAELKTLEGDGAPCLTTLCLIEQPIRSRESYPRYNRLSRSDMYAM